jgi:hypothetical protein
MYDGLARAPMPSADAMRYPFMSDIGSKRCAVKPMVAYGDPQ